MYAETEFTLDEASKYDKNDDEIPDDSGGGDDGTDGTTMSREVVKINSNDIKEQIRKSSVDILFVVGLSQLIDEDIIRMPRFGCVGFHPTKLPKGRGRAPMAWLILDRGEALLHFLK